MLVLTEFTLLLWAEVHIQPDCLCEECHCLRCAMQVWFWGYVKPNSFFRCSYMWMSYWKLRKDCLFPADGLGMGLVLTVEI